jgi:tetratricopeptide (TPR) repeat protein
VARRLVVIPAQLPADVSVFTGRAQHLADLDRLLATTANEAQGSGEGDRRSNAVVISAVSGTAGVGKTALAVHWAHRVARQFPDGQLYVNLRGFDPGGSVMNPAEAVRGFLDALEMAPQRIPVGLDAQAALYRSLLSGRRMLVVLDNARDAGQVRPLLPGAPGCLVLVTSRNQMSGLVAADGAYSVALDLLTPAESRQLLVSRLGPDRVTAEPQAVDEIIARCARLPLAMAIVAARAATHPHFPLHTLAADLRDSHNRLDAFAGGDPATDVRAVFSWSYYTLTQDAARLFRLLGLHPGPDISAPAAASLTALPPLQVRPMLAELARAHLIAEHVPGRYTFHDLLRIYAHEVAHSADTDDQRHSATYRMLDHYLHTGHTAERLLDPGREPIALLPPQLGTTPEELADHEQAMAWFTTEHGVLLAAVAHAADAGFDTHAWQLAWILTNYLDRQGYWQDQAATGRAALNAARRLADPSAQAHAHRLLARPYIHLGRYDEAYTHLQHVLDLERRSGDLAGQAHIYLVLAVVWDRQGRHAEALDHAQQALDQFRAAGHQGGQARALNAVGWYHSQLGNHHEALTACQQALTLNQVTGERFGEAATWDSLGYAHHHLGHHEQAITCYQHALDLVRNLGDRYYEANALIHLGETHHAAGNPNAARDAWQQALTILNDIDHPAGDELRTKLNLDQPANVAQTPTSNPAGADVETA